MPSIDLNGAGAGIDTSIGYTENTAAVVVANGLLVADADDTNLEGATVTIGGGFLALNDFLSIGGTAAGNISGIDFVFSSFTGVMTLTGTASLATYQSVLRQIAFQSISENPGSSRTISWTVNDGDSDSAVAVATVNIAEKNDAPDGADKAVTIPEDSSYVFAPSDFGFSDSLEGDAFLSVTLTTVPAAGTLFYDPDGAGGVDPFALSNGATVAVTNIQAGRLYFTPAADGVGTPYTSFTFQVTDDGGTANGGVDTDPTPNSFTFNVTGANDPPSVDLNGAGAGVDVGASFNENGAAVVVAPGAVVADPDDTNIESATVTITGGFLVLNDFLSIGGAPFGNIGGIDFQYSSFTGVMTLTGSASLATYQNVLRQIAFQSISDQPGASRTLSWTVNDGNVDSSAATATITIVGTNDAPEGADSSVEGSEDDPYVFTAADFPLTDPGDTPANGLGGIVVASLPSEGELRLNGNPVAVNDFIAVADINAGNFTFVPDPDEFGSPYTSFTFKVRDDGGTANGGVDTDPTASVLTIDITKDNVAPVAGDDAFTLDEDMTLDGVPPGVLANDLDDGQPDPLSVSAILVDGPDHAASFTFNADGTFTYTPVADYNGTDSFTYKLNDTELDSNVATVTLTINPVNDAPVSTADDYAVAEDSLLSVGGPGVLGNDGDIDNGSISAVLVSGPAHAGSFTFNADGSFSYQATANYNGADSFTYRASDGSALGNIVTVNLNVTPVDDVSVTGPDSFVTTESALLSSNLLGNDSDIDGPAVAVTEVNGSALNVGQLLTLASGATLQLNADGNFVYNPNGRFNTLTIAATGASNLQAVDSFTYRTDSGNTATVTIQVNGLRTITDILMGSAGNDTIADAGFNFADSFMLQQGGNDTANGLGGNDGFYFGTALDTLDSVDGGTGTDSVAFQGNYAALVLGNIINVENLVPLAGNNTTFGDLAGNFYDYNITANDANVAAGATLTVIGGNLRAGEDLVFNGAAETDGSFRIFAGQGNDALTGGARNDGFFFGADGNFTGADIVNGGGGADSVALRGNYVGGGAVVLQNGSLTNVEVVTFLSGHTNEFGGPINLAGYDYDLTTADGNVAAGQRLDVVATNLRANESLRFDGRAESDGSFRMLSGAGDDSLYGGAGNDTLSGGAGADLLEGSGGADTYLYRFANESTAASRDRINWGAGDKLDLSLIDANAGTAANDAFTFIGGGLFTGVAGQLRVTATGPNGIVEGDVDGDGVADLVIFVSSYVPVAGDIVI